MRDNGLRRLWALRSALSLAAFLVAWSFISPRLPARWRIALQAGVGGLLVVVTGAPLGLRPPRLRAGLRLGSAAGAGAATAVAASTLVPAARRGMSTHELPASATSWLLWWIPVGTVWAEETAFRAGLATAGSRAFGQPGGRLLQGVAFGLSHIPDARAGGQPVLATVLATGVVGWLFGWLADRSGSLAAPMLAHLAINEAGAAATVAIQLRSRRAWNSSHVQ
jgi:membrane protease YdiL (CAAX protease family)